MINDVSRAYFYARSESPTFVEICSEDFEAGDENNCGELQVSMYGTRQAAQNWQHCVTQLMESKGFMPARSSPCMFWHEARDIACMVHGDDFFSTGRDGDLRWQQKKIEAAFEIKTTIIGPEDGDQKQAKVLNRTVTYSKGGIDYEADPRHAELIVQELKLQESKEVVTPGIEEEMATPTSDRLLDSSHTSRYKSIVARANYLSADRPEIQYATKECARKMSKPTEGDWMKLKRLRRFLRGHPRTTLHYRRQDEVTTLTTHTDANWAGDKVTRKSTSGGAVQRGENLIKTWSKTQSLIAMSSAESELYGYVKATAECLGVMPSLVDLGTKHDGVIKADASATLGIISRRGLGKIRHLDTSFLWIHEIKARRGVENSRR